MTTINANSQLVTGSDGRLRFSGVSSGIDSQQTIDTIMTAKRIPVVEIETKISENTQRINDINEFRTLASTFTEVLDDLRGSTSFGADDVFKTKLGFLSTTDGTDPNTVMGTTIATTATTGTHKITVQQVATAHQVRADAVTSRTSTMTDLGITTGSFDIGTAAGTTTIDVTGSDTILDVRDKINNADNGVSATIVSEDDTTHYLVLTAEETGLDNAIVITGGGNAVTDSLGLTAASAFKNPLQNAQNAILDVDGITGIERSSNTVDDVIDGVTFSLFKADTDTEITLSVENDLNGIKTKVAEFIDSYNAMREFIVDQQTLSARTEGSDEETLGSLGNDPILRTTFDRMRTLVTEQVPGQADGYEGLSQIGVTLDANFNLTIDDSEFDNKLLTNVDEIRTLFAFDSSVSDSRVTVVSKTAQTQGLSDGNNDPLPYYLNIDGTDVDGNVTGANIQTSAASGSADGSATVAGTTVTATNITTADGLVLNFAGGASLGAVSDIEVTVTRGVADQMYDFFNNLTKLGGTIDSEIENISGQSEDYEVEKLQLETRLENTRASLEAQFIAMETALAQLESLRSTIDSFFNQDQNN